MLKNHAKSFAFMVYAHNSSTVISRNAIYLCKKWHIAMISKPKGKQFCSSIQQGLVHGQRRNVFCVRLRTSISGHFCSSVIGPSVGLSDTQTLRPGKTADFGVCLYARHLSSLPTFNFIPSFIHLVVN